MNKGGEPFPAPDSLTVKQAEGFTRAVEAIKADPALTPAQKLYRLEKLIGQTLKGSRTSRKGPKRGSRFARIIHPDQWNEKPRKLGSKRDLIRAGIMNRRGERTDEDGRREQERERQRRLSSTGRSVEP